MQRLEYKVSFVTPAFLGNADQQAQWRTPPFKALIRQWWRVVYAPKVNFNVDELRHREGALFGVAADGGESSRSLVHLRLGHWGCSHPANLLGIGQACHPEVEHGGPPCDNGPGRKIQASLYLGYGPVTTHGNRSFIEPEQRSVSLALMFPANYIEEIRIAMQLAAWFGTLGSRSRNGWGALQIVAKEGTSPIPELTTAQLAGVLRPIDECLTLDWPHAIGSREGRPLVWTTAPKPSWREAMKELACIKIAFRTQPALSFSGMAVGTFAKRHFLAYPVTHHKVTAWGNQNRLANQIRFKVKKSGNQWVGVIVHLPCRLPTDLIQALPAHQRNNLDADACLTWQAVHAILDQNAKRLQ